MGTNPIDEIQFGKGTATDEMKRSRRGNETNPIDEPAKGIDMNEDMLTQIVMLVEPLFPMFLELAQEHCPNHLEQYQDGFLTKGELCQCVLAQVNGKVFP
jgi:hypothetical protein